MKRFVPDAFKWKVGRKAIFLLFSFIYAKSSVQIGLKCRRKTLTLRANDLYYINTFTRCHLSPCLLWIQEKCTSNKINYSLMFYCGIVTFTFFNMINIKVTHYIIIIIKYIKCCNALLLTKPFCIHYFNPHVICHFIG